MILTIDRVNDLLDDMADSFPAALFDGLNGGINLLEEAKPDPEFPEGEMYILGEYCDDLLLSAHYLDGMRLKVADEVLDLLLEDIADPALQRALLRTMQDIVSADGVETTAEVEVLARALEKWGARVASSSLN